MTKDTLLQRAIGALGTVQAALYQLQAVPTWRRHDGTIVPITAMSYDHLENAIACVERNGAEHAQNARVYPFLLARRAQLRGKGFRGRESERTRRELSSAWKAKHPRHVPYTTFRLMVQDAEHALRTQATSHPETQAKAIVTRLITVYGVGVETETMTHTIGDFRHE